MADDTKQEPEPLEFEWNYIGDGVYVKMDIHAGLWLHANDHLHPTDRVYLEPSVFQALLTYRTACLARALRWRAAREQDNEEKKS